MTTYKEAASTAFNVLAKQYNTPAMFEGNFWFAGNTLHACLTYLVAAKETDSSSMLHTAYDIYQKLDPTSNWWRDDYGWWGNAFMFALKHRNELGYQDVKYKQFFDDLLTAAQDCFAKLSANWREQPYGALDNAAGRADISGGTFNTFNHPPMSGRNSVTNEGSWILSQQLLRVFPASGEYLAYVDQETRWFQAWLDYPNKNNGQTGILNPQGLVLERPMGNATYPAWYWSGDQGLFMEAQSFNTVAYNIATCVTTNMTDKDNILHESMGFNDYFQLQQFIADYATGKGIFMRSLAQINLALPSHPFSSFINNNAAAVWCNRMPENQFTFNWNPQVSDQEPKILRVSGKSNALCDLIMQTAGLEALSAALWLSPDEEISCAAAD